MAPQKSETGFNRFTMPLEGAVIAGLRFANPGAEPLLFCHANGFCATAYLQMLSVLGDRFDVFAIDLRGHGRSTLEAIPGKHDSWRLFSGDIACFLDTIGGHLPVAGKWVLSGHSMGATASAMAARGRSDIAALALIEPVAMPPLVRFLAKTPFWNFYARRFPLVRAALARRSVWPDKKTALERYARKPIFGSWAPGVLENYLIDGLTETDRDGPEKFCLSCSPAWEASNFAAHGNNFWGAVKAAPAPMAVLAAEKGSTALIAGGARRFRRYGVGIETASGVGHLAPQENPGLAARFIEFAAQERRAF